MATDGSVDMDAEEIAAFLGQGGTGVLSLAADDVPYSIPVSYGFDQNKRAFYFRLGFVGPTVKRRFIKPAAPARFVVYDRRGADWRSVIAAGTLEPITADKLTTEVATALQRGDLPLYEIWDSPREEIEFETYRLNLDELTGRKAPADNP